jgi:hypothetical protein
MLSRYMQPQGTSLQQPDAPPVPIPSDLTIPATWGKGHTGNAKVDTFPIPQESTFDKDGTTLDKFTIKALTRLVDKKLKENPPTRH